MNFRSRLEWEFATDRLPACLKSDLISQLNVPRSGNALAPAADHRAVWVSQALWQRGISTSLAPATTPGTISQGKR
jgi:hypothetical protein